MHPLPRLWQRIVAIAFTLIGALYIIDVSVVPFDPIRQHLRFNPSPPRDHLVSTCSDDFSVSNDHENRAAADPSRVWSDEVTKESAGDLGESPVHDFHNVEKRMASGEAGVMESSVHFRRSSWKPHIGEWLENCGEAAPILVPEQFADRLCENNCGGRGVCNHELGECRCFHGYTGRGCELEEKFVCNTNETEEWLAQFGKWRVSLCGASCDTTRSFCYCGEGTKYPQRPAAESCGFTKSWNDQVDWNLPDSVIFSNKSGYPGWCNLDPEDYAEARWLKKENCHCTYDGTWGDLCEIQVESFCINQCSGNGLCRGGFCACHEGWHGIDCSIPSSLSSLQRWPNWLVPGVLKMTGVSQSWQQQTLEVVVERRRPLIYVYELPARFNSLLLEGRHYKTLCVNRLYNELNTTIWIEDLYGIEIALLENLLSSAHRTANAEEADYFYVPVFGACAISLADEAPHLNIQGEYLGLRTYFSGDLYRQAYEYIKDTYPYWNQSSGRDHLWLFPWDEGACSAPKEIWNSMMLVHWGNTNSKYNYSTTGYHADNWNNIPEEWRGNHSCYDPDKDLVLPAWKVPNPDWISDRLWARTREQRPTLFYFNGNLGSSYNGRPEDQYSMGLRQWLAAEFGSYADKDGKIARQNTSEVIVKDEKTPLYGQELSQSIFCGVLPGDGWSGRMEDSILHGCIPVIIQDGIHLPFENVLNYEDFVIRVAEEDLPQLLSILRNVSESEVDSKLEAIRNLWQRYTYISAIQLESQRQKLQSKCDAEWIVQVDALSGDDAFATFIQVLHYKLNNRTWSKTTTDLVPRDSNRDDYCSKKFHS